MKRKLIAALLVFILVLSLVPIGVQAEDEKIYTDSRGNKITIPGGAESCAVEVVSFIEGDPWTDRKNSQGTGNILGEPDYRSIDDGSYITLGTGGVIVLKFKVDIIDGPGDDIYVFEVGPDVEGTKVEVSLDNEKWIFAGNVEGSISAVDLSGKVSKGARFKYVRITDLKTSPGGEYSGADIDAVAGLNAKVEPISSAWAKTELDKADEYGLIPDILQGADMTRPITREEFAELAVKLYEKTMNTAAVPASPNPFKDTANPEILKAFKLGVTTGTSATTFAPKELTNREQVATMLSRAIRTMAPGGDFSTSGAPTFNDRKDISSWALDHVLFMSRLGIIKGTGGKFMPKATTTAQTATGYATTTREQAIAMSVRSFEQMNTIKGSKGSGTQPAPVVAPAPVPQQPSENAAAASSLSSVFSEKAAPTKDRIVGAWVRLQANTFGTLAGTMARQYYVFYPDGTFMTDIPDNGLHAFNFQERKDSASASDTIPDYGTYNFKNGKGQLSGNNGAKLEITMDSRYGSLDIGNYKGFMFIPWLDGKRLEGAYTTIVPNLDGMITESAIAQEPESFLYLNRDGTFEDEKGIFRWQGKNYPTMDELFPTGEERDKLVHPAKGTYEIVDFSLILRYNDGVTTKHRILLDAIEMSELDYSSNVISPKEIYIRRERARSNLKFFQ